MVQNISFVPHLLLSNAVEGFQDEGLLSKEDANQFTNSQASPSFKDRLVDLTVFKQIISTATENALAQDKTVGIFPNREANFAKFGLSGFASISSRNFDETLQVYMQTLQRVLPLAKVELTNLEHTSKFEIQVGTQLTDISTFIVEAIFGELKRFEAFYESTFDLDYVSFTHKPSGPVSAYEDFFKCEVLFESKQNLVVFPERLGAIKSLSHNEAAASILKDQLFSELEGLHDNTSLGQKFRKIWHENAQNRRFLSLKDMASLFNMTSRTLSRQLEKEDTSFKALTNDIRGELAEHWLINTSESIAEVAFRLGFNDVNSFHRFFKQWSGKTPGQIRAI